MLVSVPVTKGHRTKVHAFGPSDSEWATILSTVPIDSFDSIFYGLYYLML